MATMIVGVDPGLDGGIAAVTNDGQLLYAEPMPTLRLPPSGKKTKTGKLKQGRRYVSGVQLRRYARTRDIERVAIEWVWAFMGEAPSIAFGFGAAYGTVRGAFEVLHPVDLVTPRTWQKTFQLPGGADGKALSLETAAELWPDQAGWFARKKDSGRADAALLAEHTRQTKEQQ